MIGACLTPTGRARRHFNELICLETDECIIWPHGKRDRYGMIKMEGVQVSVHVVALERRVGPRPPGAVAAHAPIVCHQRACLNYRHLRWATPGETAPT